MEIIHIVLGKVNPNRLNGVNKVVFNLASAQHLAGRNIQVWGITKNPVHDYPPRCFKTKLFLAQLGRFEISQDLKSQILEHKNAFFHIHGGWIIVFNTLAKFFAKNNISFVLTPHGAYNTVAMQRSKILKKIYFNLFEKVILKKAAKIHSLGQSEVDGLMRIFPTDKSILLPYGFEFHTTVKEKPCDSKFIIGFVGRLDVETKGLDLLLKAFYDFQQKHDNVYLWIVGEGKGTAFIKKFTLNKKLNNIVLWGGKFGVEKDALIAQMHCFAHPSRNEGLPTAVLEASAKGVPVVVSEATNVAAYVKSFKAGLVVDNDSVLQLEQALKELFDLHKENLLHAEFSGGEQMLNTVFSWQVLVEQYDKLYK